MQPYSCYQLGAIVRALSRQMTTFEGQRLLDVGSGPMDKTAVFARLGFSAYAVDDLGDPWHRLPGMLEKILAFGKKMGVHFHLQTADDYSIPFEENSFDVVTSIAVIEHLHDSPRHLLNAMGSQLRVGGLLVVVMPNAVNLRKRISVLMGKSNYNPVDEMLFTLEKYRGHVREYTLGETRYILEQAGFVVLEASTFEHLAQQKLRRPARDVYLGLGRLVRGFRSGLLVVARKPANWEPMKTSQDRYFSAIAAGLPVSVGLIEQARK